jgi:hypothetical protein
MLRNPAFAAIVLKEGPRFTLTADLEEKVDAPALNGVFLDFFFRFTGEVRSGSKGRSLLETDAVKVPLTSLRLSF